MLGSLKEQAKLKDKVLSLSLSLAVRLSLDVLGYKIQDCFVFQGFKKVNDFRISLDYKEKK